MVDHGDPVARGMDVGFDAAVAETHGVFERRHGVLRPFGAAAPMGDGKRPSRPRNGRTRAGESAIDRS